MSSGAHSFEDFVAGLSSLGADAVRGEPGLPDAFASEASALAAALRALDEVSPEMLANLIRQHPRWVPLLASCVGLGLEQLRRQLEHRLGSSGWLTLARRHPERVIGALDEGFGLVAAVREQRSRDWQFVDILIERARWSQRSASRSIFRGRSTLDAFQRDLTDAARRLALLP